MTSMSKLNVQYSSKALLDNVFKCKHCKSPLLMFGCDNEDCGNTQIKKLLTGLPPHKTTNKEDYDNIRNI